MLNLCMSVCIDMHIFIYYSCHSDLYSSITYVRYFQSSAKCIINMSPNSVAAHARGIHITKCLFTTGNMISIRNEVIMKDKYV